MSKKYQVSKLLFPTKPLSQLLCISIAPSGSPTVENDDNEFPLGYREEAC